MIKIQYGKSKRLSERRREIEREIEKRKNDHNILEKE